MIDIQSSISLSWILVFGFSGVYFFGYFPALNYEQICIGERNTELAETNSELWINFTSHSFGCVNEYVPDLCKHLSIFASIKKIELHHSRVTDIFSFFFHVVNVSTPTLVSNARTFYIRGRRKTGIFFKGIAEHSFTSYQKTQCSDY